MLGEEFGAKHGSAPKQAAVMKTMQKFNIVLYAEQNKHKWKNSELLSANEILKVY